MIEIIIWFVLWTLAFGAGFFMAWRFYGNGRGEIVYIPQTPAVPKSVRAEERAKGVEEVLDKYDNVEPEQKQEPEPVMPEPPEPPEDNGFKPLKELQEEEE